MFKSLNTLNTCIKSCNFNLIIFKKKPTNNFLKDFKPKNTYCKQNEKLKAFNDQKRERELKRNAKTKKIGLILSTVIVSTLAASYAAVPLYNLFCRTTGFGGTPKEAKGKAEKKSAVNPKRPLKIDFSGNKTLLPWTFEPLQPDVIVVPGEPALVFYKATNNSDKELSGVATFNVNPLIAGKYFVKVQCFCFDEQLLQPNETIDMPVLFYIDEAFLDDPKMFDINLITLSYTFFATSDF